MQVFPLRKKDSNERQGNSVAGGNRRCGGRLRVLMARAEMALDASAPPVHKRKVHRSADGGAGKGNQAASPLLGTLLADLYRHASCNAGRDFFEHLFFDKILAVIDSSGGRGRLPHLAPGVRPARFETVKKAEPLNEPQCDYREQTRVGEERDHPSQSKTRAFYDCQSSGIADQGYRDGVETLERQILHAAEIRDPHAVLTGELPAKNFRVYFDGAQTPQNTKSQKTSKNTASRRATDRLM
jgi:hypothetical protein